MGTRALTGGPSPLINAQIAFRGFQERLLGIVTHNLPFSISNFYHADIVIGTALGTDPTTDASQIVYDDGSLGGIAANGACWTANHAYWIDTMHAGMCELEPIMDRTGSYKTWIVIMGGSTRSHTIIASRATIQINDHRLGTVHQAMIEDELQ